jgi:hypothetical protein
MLNKMRFYCQPILPLVYDESMSYYETLCKVVGQLNTTGETVNKLNEGLTGEIADRQAADAALDKRLKLLESANVKLHFLIFDGANPNGGMPTRDELYQWVHEGDAIFTLFRTNEEGRGQVYAVSCAYNAGSWDSAASNDFNIIVPIETSYDAVKDYAVRQKIAKLTIPPSSKPSLNVPWDLQIIEIDTPATTADGVVNFTVNISDSGSVNGSITPSEFLQLYNVTRGGKKMCVAVNAKLVYDGIARSSSIATVDPANRIIRIVFERDYGTAIANGVNQLNKTVDYIIGDAKKGVWTHESIDSKVFDFPRYEGFQFTRGANNVITTDDESTPNAVYTQYHATASGKLYQNLPTRLIDTVDGAEYWNGTFDVYGGNHMTFTFVTSNYATSSDRMLVRVIELSADANTTAWKCGVKEFTLPLEASNDVVTYTASKVGEGEYLASVHRAEYQVDFAEGIPAIITSIESGKRVIFRVDLKEIDSVTGATPVYFASGYTKASLSSGNQVYLFAGDILNGNYSLQITSGIEHATLIYYGETLPMPNPDGSDNGKAPRINGNKWELQNVDGAKDYPVNITVPPSSVPTSVNAGIAQFTVSCDKTFAEIKAAIDAGKNVFGNYANNIWPLSYATDTMVSFAGVINFKYFEDASNATCTFTIQSDDTSIITCAAGELPAPALDGSDNGKVLAVNGTKWGLKTLPSAAPVDTAMSDTSTNAVQNKVIKKYVDDSVAGASGSAGAVRYDAAQTLTDPQKLQARKNVDAAGVVMPQFQGFLTLTPANAPTGTGVGLSPSRDGNNFALNISDVNEDTPTLLTGVKTPTDADTNAAATVEYVKNKVADGGSSDAVLYTEQTLTDAQKKQARDNIYAAIADFVVNGTVNSNPETGDNEVTLDKTFTQIQAAIQEGKHPAVHLSYEERSITLLPLVAYSTHGVAFAAAVADAVKGNITSVELIITPDDDILFDISTSPALNSDGDLIQFTMASDPITPMEIATKKYVDNHPGGAPITIKLGTGNAATSTATFAEIKAALEAGKAPILDSAPGTSHWFALNWVLSGTDILTIQYGTFNVGGGGKANFTVYDVSVSTTVITYSSREFTTE